VLLEGATLLSGTGSGVATVALPLLILERTGSATAAGVVAAGTTLPLLLSSLLSATVVDLVGRRRVSMLSDLLSLGSVVAIPLVDAAGGLTVPALVGLALLGALFDPAGITAREAMLPAAADVAGLPRVRLNGVHEAVWAFAFLIGPGVGGVLSALDLRSLRAFDEDPAAEGAPVSASDWPDDDRWDGDDRDDVLEHDLPPHGEVSEARRDDRPWPARRRRSGRPAAPGTPPRDVPPE